MPPKNVLKQIDKFLKKAEKNNFNQVAETKINNVVPIEEKVFTDQGKVLFINEDGTIATSAIKADKIDFIKNLDSPIATQIKDFTNNNLKYYINGKIITGKNENFNEINSIYQDFSAKLKQGKTANEISDGQTNRFIINGSYDGDIFVEGTLRNSEGIVVHNTYTSLDTNTYEAPTMHLTKLPEEITKYPRQGVSFSSKSSSNISNYGSNRAFDGATSGIFVWMTPTTSYQNGVYTGSFYIRPDYKGEYIIINLGEETIINKIKLYGRGNADAQRHPRNYRIYGSNDVNDYNNPQGGNWTQVFDKINNTEETVPSSYPSVEEFFDNFASYRYYAFVINEIYSGNQITELLEWELYHVQIPDPSVPIQPTNVQFGDDTTDMLAWYKFDGDLSDSSGNGKHFTGGTGTSFIDNRAIGTKSISFPKLIGQELSSTVDLSNNISFSISLWIYRDIADQIDYIVSTEYIGETYRNLALGYYGNIFRYSLWGFGVDTTETFPNDVDEWVHWTCTYNSANGSIKTYRNGVSVASGNALEATNFGTSLIIGNRNGDLSSCKIDDLRIYNRELTESEISELYNYSDQSDAPTLPQNQTSGAVLRITQGNVKNIIDASVGPNNVFSVSHSGNLGIKTKYPTEKLDVRGSIKVSGNINDTSSTLIEYAKDTKDSVQYQIDLINENITVNDENMISQVNTSDQETSNYTIRGMINQINQNTQDVQTYIEGLIDDVANTKQDVLTMSNGIRFNSDKNFIELVQDSEWNTENDHINYGSVQLHRDSIKINDNNAIFSDEIAGKQDKSEENAIINNLLYQDLPPNKVLQISKDSVIMSTIEKYPREPLVGGTTTYTDGTVVNIRVQSSYHNNYQKHYLFNGNNAGWASPSFTYSTPSGVANNTYRTGVANGDIYPGEYVMIDLGEEIILDYIKVYPRDVPLYPSETKKAPNEFRIYASNTNTSYDDINDPSWVLLYEGNNPTDGTSTETETYIVDNNTQSYRYYVMIINKVFDADMVHFSELEFYAKTGVDVNVISTTDVFISTTDVLSEKLENLDGLTANVQQQIDDLIVVIDNVSNYLTDITIQPDTNMSNYVSDVYNEFVVNIESKQDKLIFGSNINYDEATNTVSISGASIEVQSEVQTDLWKSAVPDTKFGNNLKDLYAWYKFDGIYNDHSKNKNIAIPYNSPTFDTSSKAEGTSSLSFSATGSNGPQYLKIQGTDFSKWLGGISLCFWVYFDTITGEEHIFDFSNSYDTSKHIIVKRNLDKLELIISGNILVFDYTFTATEWKHIIISLSPPVDGSSRYELYIDGVFIKSYVLNYYVDGGNYDKCLIGIGENESAYFFNGKLDDVRIYSKTTTQEEALLLYNYPKDFIYENPPKLQSSDLTTRVTFKTNFYNDTTDMIAWYKFDGNFNDSSGNLQQITVSNFDFSSIMKSGSKSLEIISSPAYGYISSNSINYFTPTNDFSVAFWCYIVDNTGYEMLMTTRNTNVVNKGGWSILVAPGRKIFAETYKTSGAKQSGKNYMVNVGWVHISFVLNYNSETSSSFSLYLNGILQTPSANQDGDIYCQQFSSSLDDEGNILYIGTDRDGINLPCDIGTKFDDLRFYNRALTPQEIRTLYADTVETFYNDTTDMIAWYKFDDIGNPGLDSSGKNQHLLNNNASINTIIKKTDFGSLDLTLTNDYLYNTTSYNYGKDNAISFSVWFYINSLTPNNRIFSASPLSGIHNMIVIDASLHNKITLVINSGTDNSKRLISTVAPPLNTWVHIYIVIEKDPLIAKLYINGILNVSNTNMYYPVNSLEYHTNIGVDYEKNNMFEGYIDDFRIYNRALTSEEIGILSLGNEKYFSNNTTSMLAWYKFDGDLLDSSGNGKDLTGGTGTSFVDDSVVGTKSISFPKQNNQSLISNIDLSGNKSFTISLWSYRNSDMIVEFMISAGDSKTNHRLLSIGYTGDNKIYFGFWTETLYTEPLQDQNTWVHWTMIYDSDNKIKHLYKNGMFLQSTAQPTATNIPATENNFRIGTQLDGTPFDGKLDDIRVYNRVISAQEVTELYETTKKDFTANDTTNMLAWYKFDGDGNDSSGNDNHLSYHTLDPSTGSTITALTPLFTTQDYVTGTSSFYNDITRISSRWETTNNIVWSQDITICMWLKITNDNANNYTTVVHSLTSPYTLKYHTGTAGNTYAGVVLNGNGTTFFGTNNNVFKADSKWHFHVLRGKKNTDNTINVDLYIDNILIETWLNKPFNNTPQKIQVMGYRTIGNNVTTIDGVSSKGMGPIGNIDDLRIYNRALSEDEIYKVYMNKSESRWTMSDMQKELIVQNVKTYPPESKNNFQLYGSNDKLAYQLKTLNTGWNLIYDTQNISLPVIKKQLVDSEYNIIDEKDTILESDIKNHIYNVVYDALPNTWYDMETIAKQNGGRLPTKTEMDNYVLGVNSGIITNKIHKEYDSDAAIHSVWFGISEKGLSGYTSTIRPFYRVRYVSGTLQGEVHNNSSNPGGVNNGNNNIFKWIWYITDFSLIKTSNDGYYYDLNNVADFELVKYPREPLIGVSTTYSDGIVVRINASTEWSSTQDPISHLIYNSFNNILNDNGWGSGTSTFNPSTGEANYSYQTGYSGEYFIIDLGEKILLDSIKIYPRTNFSNGPYRRPKIFRIYASNNITSFDDINDSNWNLIYEGNNIGDGSELTPHTYIINNIVEYQYYSIIVNKIFVNIDSKVVQFAELEFYGYPLLTNITYVKFPRKLYTAPSDDITFSSTDEQFNQYFPYKAFDGITYTISNTYFTGQYYDGPSRTHIRSEVANINGYGGEWLRIDMKENIVVNSYQIYPQNGDAGRWARAPGDFKIFGSKDNITHYELDSRTNLTWPSGNSKIFEISNNNENYRYYTIVVNKIAETLATGNYAFVISEWELYGDPKSDLNYSIEFPTNKDVKFITSDAVNTLTFEKNKTYHITKHENSTSINIFNPYIHPTITHNSTIDTPTQISNTNEYYYSFTSTTGTNSITFDRDTICDILVVGGGGGGGGRHGGGGGAGGLIYETNIHIPQGTYSVVVGGGGAGGIGAPNTQGYKGGNSSFNGLVAIGGGAGQAWDITSGRQNGGSGGGGTSTTYGLGINGQGNDGGISITNGDPYNWAGGGGAGEVGGNSTLTTCGNGGNGLEISITGLAQYYAGGGGGGSHNPAASTKGLGGLGGGGDGGTPGVDNKGDNGVDGTGGGGGGASTSTGGGSPGGNGGNGIVIIRWTANPNNLRETLYETSENIRLTWSKIDNYLPYRYYLVKELTDNVFTEIELVGKEPNLLTWNNGTNTSSVNIDSDNNTIYIHDGGGNYHRISTVNDLLLKEKNKFKFLPGLKYNKNTSELSLTNKWTDNSTHLSHKNIKIFDDKIEIGNQGSLQSQSIYTTNIRNSNPINIGDNITVYEDDNTYCVKATDNIWLDGADLTFTSDERIKKEISDIDDDSALDKIMKIDPKSYKYIDSIKKGDNEVFGFISQQVKEVLPEATSETSKFIPNIYKLCKCEHNKIFLPTDLDVSKLVSTYNGSNISNVVRLIDKNQNNIDILFSIEGKSLLVDYSLPVSEIFVYGTLIDDLTTIEKSYIYTLNVCATQVINRKITDLNDKNEILNTKSSEIEQRLAILETKISNMYI